MARPCSSKAKKLGLIENENSWKCRLKLEFPPIPTFQDSHEKMKREKSLKPTENFQSLGRKFGLPCHFEERLKRAENRRRKVFQKLKENYNIDLEGLNENLTREIILKTKMMEKEKKEREKRKTERMMAMISKLIEEEKYKNQVSGKVCFWKKTIKNLANSERVKEVTQKVPEIVTGDALEKDIETEASSENIRMEVSDLELSQTAESEQEGETNELPKCVERKKPADSPEIIPPANIIRKHTFSVTLENCLESTPKCVTFKDYRKNKVYLQNLQIRSISCETIHCRYLGIIVQTKGEEKFPIGVAVRDNVKLRPGLYCSTKIRLCSKDDKKELKCSIVYETRRQKNPSHRSLFFVPVVCTPVRAIVKVIPLKITFPPLTWCEATGPEAAKLLIKHFRIENSGGKACSCRISKVKYITEDESVQCYGEYEGEVESLKNKSHKWEGSSREKKSYGLEFDGEGCLTFYDNPEEFAKSLVAEMIEFACATFRFSKIFYIEVPPYSTTHFQVKFTPFYKGFHYETYYLLFEDCDNITEETIEIMGDIKQMPLRTEPEVIDLKTCIANSGVYAGTFKVFNESKGPYSVVLKVPPSLKNHAHIYPRGSTILPLKSSDFSVRIYPRITLAKDVFRYYNEDSQILEFPIFIYPANSGVCKRDYMKIYVLALITDYCLSLSPPFINFGVVTTLETVRTELELTNHSLASQEFGFLNLPKGVRVEPNMGFGKILPKETITLYLLYSPGDDLVGEEGHDFQVTVTSIAKYGGFKEKLEVKDSESKTDELIWGEDYYFELGNETSYSELTTQFMQPEDSEDFDACEEESSIEGEECCSKLYQEENKIREFLRDFPKVSEHSNNKRTSTQTQNNSADNPRDSFSEYGIIESTSSNTTPPKSCTDRVQCRASVIKPRCQLSATVIQLPATSCSSFTLYRFRLYCMKQEENISCPCGFRKAVKCEEDNRIPSSFEFRYNCPHIKLEPQTGFIKPGDNFPITIIHRPECAIEQLQQVPSPLKMRNSLEAKAESQSAITAKKKPLSSKSKVTEVPNKNSLDVMHMMSSEIEFTGDKNPGKFMNPFSVETKVQCIVKTKFCGEQIEKTEVHEMVVICPVIQPNFIYLGIGQEIKFNKVFVGTKSRMILQIQSNSIERTSPSATLLNPVGPFFCPAGVAQVVLDPEHIWQQPLIYAPLEENGINKCVVLDTAEGMADFQVVWVSQQRFVEAAAKMLRKGFTLEIVVWRSMEQEKQFFEIYCGTTNIFLMVSGEAIRPEYSITPDFELCIIEAKPGRPEELKLDIENFSAITLNIYIEINFEKEGPDLERISKSDEMSLMEDSKKEKKEDLKDKKKSKNPENEIFQMWEEIPEAISLSLPKFEDVDEENKTFTLVGFDDDNKIQILPSGKAQIKILFKPPEDKSDRSFAVKYSFTLERASLLKEILLLGKITKGLQK